MKTSDPSDEAIEIYDRIADRFDVHAESSAHNAYYDRPATTALLPNVRGKRVLDAGCGSGAYSTWLVERGAQVVAIDASYEMVILARKKVGGNAEVYRHDLRIPLDFLESGSFDVVVCPLVLDHIHDLKAVFVEFHRLLRSDGLFVFSMSHPFNDYIKQGSKYFEVEPIRTQFPNLATEMPSYRRPLADIWNALVDARFLVDRMVEPQPVGQCEKVHPETFNKLSTRPVFICFRAKKLDWWGIS